MNIFIVMLVVLSIACGCSHEDKSSINNKQIKAVPRIRNTQETLMGQWLTESNATCILFGPVKNKATLLAIKYGISPDVGMMIATNILSAYDISDATILTLNGNQERSVTNDIAVLSRVTGLDPSVVASFVFDLKTWKAD